MTTAQKKPPEIATTPGWRLFEHLFADAKRAGLALVPIRPRAHDVQTALATGDYDLLMPPDGFPLLVRVLWERAAQERAHFSLNCSHRHKVQVHVHLPEVGRSILLEIWTHLEVRDPARCSARMITWPAIAARLIDTPDGPRLPPDIEIAYYLSHLATRAKKIEAPLVAQRLANYVDLAQTQAPAVLPLIEELTNHNLRERAIAANAHLRTLGVLAPRTMVAAVIDSLRARLNSLSRQQRRRALRRARIITMTGPDGSGKSTIITRWSSSLGKALRSQRFKNLFRHHPFYQLVYLLRAGKTRRDLGGKMEKNIFDEIHAVTMFHIARAAWPWFRLWVIIVGRRCLDRGFPDLLFTGLRGSTPNPALHADWQRLARIMPQPSWHVHLDAPNEVIRSRKQELSPAALTCYRDGIARIIGAAPAIAISRIDTSVTVEEVERCLRLASADLGVRLPWNPQ